MDLLLYLMLYGRITENKEKGTIKKVYGMQLVIFI